MTIPIANPIVSDAAKAAVDDVLDSGMLAAGEEVRAFEAAFADFVGVDHAIATASGTAALHTMLEAAGIGEGDTVLTSPFSFVASANAAVHAGADPVFADVRRDTLNLDPAACREVLESRDVDAIMPVHLYGLPAAMDEFGALAEEYDCRLFEDAAQAHGAEHAGQPAGGLADAGAFSFYPTKNMTTAEGGMITTDDPDLAERARRLIDHGRVGRYEHAVVGYNYRLTNVAAAIGRDQLQRLPGWVDDRRENAAALRRELADVETVEPLADPTGRRHAYHQFTARVDRREAVIDVLESNDVGHAVYYPRTIPDQPAYDAVEDIPVARAATESVLSLPVHPSVDRAGVETIGRVVREAAGGSP